MSLFRLDLSNRADLVSKGLVTLNEWRYTCISNSLNKTEMTEKRNNGLTRRAEVERSSGRLALYNKIVRDRVNGEQVVTVSPREV